LGYVLVGMVFWAGGWTWWS